MKKGIGKLVNHGLYATEIAFVIFTLGACDAQQLRKAQLDDLGTYVQQHRDSASNYVDRTWTSLDSEFQVKKVALDKNLNKMDDDMRHRYDKIIAEWNVFQTEYGDRTAERKNLAAMDNLRASLALGSTRTDFTDATPSNVLAEYEHFLNTVRVSKDSYTKDEWTVVNVSWQSLNGRKREIEKDIPADSKTKIMKLQLEYTALKAVNRPLAKN